MGPTSRPVHSKTWLVALLFVIVSIAGCLGGDDEPKEGEEGKGGEETGTETEQDRPEPGDDENTTPEPAPVPVADLFVQMAIEDNASQDPPFIARPGDVLTFTLDASNSSVEEGTIDAYSWSVIRPGGQEVQATTSDPTFTLSVNNTSNPTDYGVYEARLRVMTDQLQLDSTHLLFALSYENTFAFAHDLMIGPALDCEHYQAQSGGDLAGTGIVHGTYGNHSVKVGPNATAINTALKFTTDDPTTEMKLYLFSPEAPMQDTNCDEAVAESEADTASVSASLDDLEVDQRVAYGIRAQMIGLTLSGYTLDVQVRYAVPEDSGEDGGEGGGEGPAVEEVDDEADHTVTIEGSSVVGCGQDEFSPATLTVDAGDVVRWFNDGGCGHTATSGDEQGEHDGLFDTGDIPQDGHSENNYRFNQTGTYSYYCDYHPNMELAEIVVE